MITFHNPEWIESPDCVSLHSEVLLDASDITAGVKPCPFCGSLHLTIGNSHTPCFSVVCDLCGATVTGRGVWPRKGSYYPTRKAAMRGYRAAFKSAVEHWNMRAKKQRAFNVNNIVLVKLTEQGRKLLKSRNHYIPKEDKDGYSEWQIWSLMNALGADIGPCFNDLPFETVIKTKYAEEA